MLKNLDTAFKNSHLPRQISPIMPATRDYNLSVDLHKLVGPIKTERLKQININTSETLDGMSLFSPSPKFKLTDLDSVVSESQQSRR